MKSALIAHRGEPESWPENSLAGFQAVLEAGARLLETDVQLTSDRIPVLSHDPTVLKMTGHDLAVAQTSYAELRKLPAGQPEQFGERFAELNIVRLDEFCMRLKQWPDARAFVEIKQASLDAFGIETVVDIVLDTLADVAGQCVLISFNAGALQYARRNSPLPIGWVLKEWSDTSRATATALAPQYLFVNRTRLPDDAVPWAGPWQWVVYTVNSAQEILRFLERGMQLVETNVVSKLLQDPALNGASSTTAPQTPSPSGRGLG
jgi:glycerophosphoryl diester phosphodiesterase